MPQISRKNTFLGRVLDAFEYNNILKGFWSNPTGVQFREPSVHHRWPEDHTADKERHQWLRLRAASARPRGSSLACASSSDRPRGGAGGEQEQEEGGGPGSRRASPHTLQRAAAAPLRGAAEPRGLPRGTERPGQTLPYRANGRGQRPAAAPVRSVPPSCAGVGAALLRQ